MNENAAYIFDIEEPKDWTFDGEPRWISGWFISKTEAVFTDIRAVIEGVPHLGVLGLPRPEIEERHRGRVGLPHAGFLLRVCPPRSARELRIELLDAGNRWVEIWRTKIKVRRGQNTIGRFNLEVLPLQMRRLLQARRAAAPGADIATVATELVLEASAVPLDTLPNPPFFGALERPELIGGTQFGRVRLEGWLIHQHQRIRRLIASAHPHVEHEIDYGERERHDAAALFPSHPDAARSQYFGMLDVDESMPGPFVIKMWAELDDGTRHLVFIRRFFPRVSTQWERPLPAFSRAEFFAAARALVAACSRLRIRMGKPAARWRAFAAAYRMFRQDAPVQLPDRASLETRYDQWRENNRIFPRVRERLEAAAASLGAAGPAFTLLVDARAATREQLAELTRSLSAQIYPRWEAILVGATAPTRDARIKTARLTEPKDWVRTLNAAAHSASGELLTLIPARAQLSPDALLEIAERFAATPRLELVYTDEDCVDADGRHHAPNFKPDWSPTLALSTLFPGHLCVVRRARFVEQGSFLPDFDRIPWAELLLRLGDNLRGEQVAHVPLVCFHSLDHADRGFDPADVACEQHRSALAAAARRRNWPAEPFLPAAAHEHRVPFHQLRWKAESLPDLAVTIVIPTRDRLHLLQECVELLEETVDWRHVKLVIVDDHSRDADAVRYLARIQQRTDLRCVVTRLPDAQAPFNYSRLVNAALPHIDTPLVLHLNNDVNALERGWLEEMVAWFTQPDVGVVGAKLIFPDKTLNHTGIIIGPHGGLADTPFAKVEGEQVPPVWHAVAREVSAVTGACLLTRTELYRELGGFDEASFGVAYNDVDYCLRVRARGFRVLYTPQAKLMHWGSATRGVTFDEAEHIAWLQRYPGYQDPYLSPHLRLNGARLECRLDRAARTNRAGRLRLLLLTHNLNLEGAPLFLLEYAAWVVREAGFAVEVLAARDGPLRAAYERIGARITVADSSTLFAAPDEEVFHARLLDIAHQIDWEQIDLVVCNTLMSFWGVPLARRAGKPSLFYIHESTSVFRFFEPALGLGLHRLVHEALGTATRTLFLCAASRAYHEDANFRGNYRIVPSWIDLEAIAQFRQQHDRDSLRRKHGLPLDRPLIANIGTVCERKGQHIFIRAIESYNRRHHRDGPVHFVMVGARPGIYLDLLRRDIARLGLTNVTLIPETREVFDFFVAADMFVCTSYEESFPRVVMEAMAFGTPIVSTDVHGIAELVGQRQDGYLVKPGDVEGLTRMMHTCLAKERSGKSLAPTAYSKVLRFCDARRVLPLHAELAREAFLAHE